jgi:exonuclease VII small subunit
VRRRRKKKGETLGEELERAVKDYEAAAAGVIRWAKILESARGRLRRASRRAQEAAVRTLTRAHPARRGEA